MHVYWYHSVMCSRKKKLVVDCFSILLLKNRGKTLTGREASDEVQIGTLIGLCVGLIFKINTNF